MPLNGRQIHSNIVLEWTETTEMAYLTKVSMWKITDVITKETLKRGYIQSGLRSTETKDNTRYKRNINNEKKIQKFNSRLPTNKY